MHLHHLHFILQGRPRDVSTEYRWDIHGAQRCLGTWARQHSKYPACATSTQCCHLEQSSGKPHAVSFGILHLGTNPAVSLGLLFSHL